MLPKKRRSLSTKQQCKFIAQYKFAVFCDGKQLANMDKNGRKWKLQKKIKHKKAQSQKKDKLDLGFCFFATFCSPDLLFGHSNLGSGAGGYLRGGGGVLFGQILEIKKLAQPCANRLCWSPFLTFWGFLKRWSLF